MAEDTLDKDSAMIALTLVGVGAQADVAFRFAQIVTKYLSGRPYDDLLDLETLRKIADDAAEYEA